METNLLKVLIQKTVQEAISLAEDKLNIIFPEITLSYSLTGVIAGEAFPYLNILDFNLIIANNNLQEFLYQTVPHEVAHLADLYKFKKVGHGRTWKYIMSYVFHLEPKRCHQMDTTGVKRNSLNVFLYSCKCRDHEVLANRHKKIQAGAKTFSCVKCRSKITFKEYKGKE